MSVFNGAFVSGLGPILTIGVLPNVESHDPQDNRINSLKVPALIDTGARSTCISHDVAEQLGIKALGLKDVNTVAGVSPRRYYLVTVRIPFAEQDAERGDGYTFTDIIAIEFTPTSNSPYQALIGRDILCRGAFIMTSDGRFTFAI